MSASLGTHSVGVIMLGVHDLGMLYSCTSAEITNTINDLPSANLIVGQGSPLSSSVSTWYTNGNLADLLEMGTELRKIKENDDKAASSKLLRCSIYEADAKGTGLKAIFRGYIVSVLELSRAGTLSVKALRVQCMGLAALLHIAPLAGFRRTSGAAITNAAGGIGELPTARPSFNKDAIDSSSALANTTDDAIIEKFGEQLADKDILTRIAYIANVIVYMSEARAKNKVYQTLKEANDNLLHITDCIFCQYNVNTEIQKFRANANKSFNKYICGQLLQTLQGASILMSIGSVCTGTDVMMNLIPHFKLGGAADDFRMELRPVEAWDTSTVLSISNDYVTACNSTLNHLEHLGDPQVLIVNYSTGVGDADMSGQNGVPAKGSFGVYSPIKSVAEWAKVRYNLVDKTSENTEMSQGTYRVRFYPAPRWLDWAYLANMYTPASSLRQPDRIPKSNEQARSGKSTSAQDDKAAAAAQADAIAKALYLHLHGSSDVAAFELTPDLRFGLNSEVGCLEDHIGKLVDVNNYRGMLQSVKYTYTSGKTTTGSYSITLSRVRPISKNEKPLVCPLYTQTKTKAANTGMNNKLWTDNWKKWIVRTTPTVIRS